MSAGHQGRKRVSFEEVVTFADGDTAQVSPPAPSDEDLGYPGGDDNAFTEELMSSSYPDNGIVSGERAILANKLARMQESLSENAKLLDTLKSLPLKLSYETMIPLGRFAMLPAKLQHTNEVLVHLGCGYYSWQTAHKAQVLLCNRLNKAVSEIEKLKQDIIAAGQREIDGNQYDRIDGSRPDRSRAESIQNPFDDPQEFRLSMEEAEEVHKLSTSDSGVKGDPSTPIGDHEDIMEKLRYLEQLEAEIGSKDAEETVRCLDEDNLDSFESEHIVEPASHDEILARLDELERQEKNSEQGNVSNKIESDRFKDTDSSNKVVAADSNYSVLSKVVERPSGSVEIVSDDTSKPSKGRVSLFKQNRMVKK